jgi:hypothetical protein
MMSISSPVSARHILGARTPSQRVRTYSQKELEEFLRREEKARVGEKDEPLNKEADKKDDSETGAIVPVTFERAFMLTGEFGRTVDNKVHEMFPNIPAIDCVSYNQSKNVVVRSNPFYVVAVNMTLRELFPGIRTANQGELEFIAQNDSKHPLHLKGNYWEDSSLVWRSNENPNEYLAKEISNRFSIKGTFLVENRAYVIPLHTLNLFADSKLPYKLTFDVTDETIKSYFEAPVLMSPNGRYIASGEIDKNGIPIRVYEKDQSGENRKLWTRDSGLSRLYLDWDLSLYSDDGNLALSYDSGRVVCVSSEATAKKYGIGGT